MLKGEGVWLVVADLVLESFVLAAVHIGLVTLFLSVSNKTLVVLCSAPLSMYLYMNGKVLYL